MRAVVDTNVLISGVLWHGAPHRLLQHVRTGTLTLISSPELLAELADVLERPKFKTLLRDSRTSAERIVRELRRLAEVIDAPPLQRPGSRDPDDDAVLALAVASQADVIISGDSDLLRLRTYSGIPIVDPAAAVEKIIR